MAYDAGMQSRVAAPAAPAKTSAARAWAPELREVQRKLMVGPAGDRFEQEADRVADVVLAGGDAPAVARRGAMAQRQCAACDREQEVAQRKCDACASDEMLQRKSDGSAEAAPALSARIDARRGGGVPLAGAARARFEPRFGHDLGGVRVHTDGEAASLNRALGAAAFTIGSDIFFGAGRYQPSTPAGQRLLAHELTHTVQQGAAAALDGQALRMQRLDYPRIQKMDDATFERVTGVGAGLTARPPTLTPVTGVNGATFTASGCRGVAAPAPAPAPGAPAPAPAPAPCDISFRFEKAYRGDYPYASASGRAVRGVYVKIVMTPSAGCGACTTLPVLQALRSTTMTGGSMASADPVDNTRRARSGWTPTGPAAGAPSPGWRVDTTTTGASATSPVPWVSNTGDATHPAIMWDCPANYTSASNTGNDIRTCVLCARPGQPSVPLACVDWGYYTSSTGAVSFTPATPSPTCGASTTVRDAATRWNAIPGNTPVNLTPP